jgi:uncharacterized protein involved in exopolysaccharide biosynthesis
MKRLLHLAMRLYPAQWRARYGVEFQYLLDDSRAGWRDLLDVARTGLHLRLTTPLNTIKEDTMMNFLRQHKVAAGICLGVLLLIGGWFQQAIPEYEAHTTIMVDGGPSGQTGGLTLASLEAGGRSTVINAMMSSTRLQRIIDTYDLYKPLKGHKTQDEIVRRMRSDISVEIIRNSDGVPGPGAFRISYRGMNPQLVAQVANQLASLFIEENLKRRMLEDDTLQVLDARLAALRKQLTKQEAELRAAKSAEDRASQTRDLSLLREYYAKLFIQRQERETAADLEKHQRSERFTILDPARIPEKPSRLVPPFWTAGW